MTRRRWRTGGCDFAVDPKLRADQTTTVWLPRVDPRLATLISLPSELFGSPGLYLSEAARSRTAVEGEYLALASSPPSLWALLLRSVVADGAIGVVLPLDAFFEDRLDVARRLLRMARTGRAAPVSLSAYRRRRLKLALQALDGFLAGADYRSIAEALFGARVPRGPAFRDDSLRAQAIRLVRYGQQLRSGGYLDILRPERRAGRRRRLRGG